MESGDRLTVQDWSTSANDFAGPDELTVTGNPNISHGSKTFLKQFNPGVFTAPPNGTRGNSGLGTIQGPGQNNFDLSLAKTFKIWESLNASFRADAFNAFNHTQWTGAQTANLYSGEEFGQATGAREPRITQLSLKVSF